MRSLIALILLAAGCTTPARQAPSFATGFEVPESDGILVEWRGCAESAPCMRGDAADTPYVLAFKGSPTTVTGKLGGEPVKLRLDPDSVTRLGDHGIEMNYLDEKRGLLLELTWNELDQEPIAYELIRMR